MWEAEGGSPLRNFHASNSMTWRVWAGRFEAQMNRRREREKYFNCMSVEVLIDDGGLEGVNALQRSRRYAVRSECKN